MLVKVKVGVKLDS